VTALPAVVVLLSDWDQNVSATRVSTYWWITVWPAGVVTARAVLQLCPAAQTSEPVPSGVRWRDGAPVSPLAPREAAICLAAPVKAATVIDPSKDVSSNRAVTCTELSFDVA
jgi:hypothetical protein